ncbi:MAG TPA: MFS transporter [Chloroflexia bacterium]|nr:MFS transporter [Chloroflexia bacterium]
MTNYFKIFGTISRPARLFLASTVLYWLGMTIVQLYLNFYLQGLGLDQSWIGLINATPSLTTVLFTLVIGSVSQRLGPWLSMVAGTAVAGLGILGMVVSPSPWMVLAASAINGLGGGFVWSNLGPFLMLNSQERQRSTLFSLQASLGTMTGFIANMGAGVLPGYLAGIVGAPVDSVLVMQVIIAIAGGIYLAALVPILFARTPQESTDEKTITAVEVVPLPAPRKRRFLPDMSDPGLWFRLIFPGAIVGLGAGMIMPFMNIYIEGKFNIDFAGLGQLFAWTSLATAVALMVQPVLADKFGKVKSVVLVQGASLPFLVMLGFSGFFPLVVVAMFVRGALMNMGNPIFTAYSMERIPERERATFSAMTASLWSLGWAGGSWASGALRDAVGFTTGFNLLFGMMLVFYATSMVLMWVWFVRPEARARREVVEERGAQAA